MKLKHAGFREGVLWVRSGFRVFFRYPLAFTGLFMMFMFGELLLLVLPWLGPVLFLASLPLVSAGFVLATERALRGRAPLPDVFFEPLRTGRARRVEFAKLGVLYTLAVVLVVALISAIDGDRLERWQQAVWEEAQQGTPQGAPASAPDAQPATPDTPADQSPAASRPRSADRALIEDPQLQFSLLLRLALIVPLSLVFWHAPALIHWGGVPVTKSLFFSAVACWRNLGAFIGFGLAWSVVVLTFGAVTTMLFVFIGQPQLVPLAVMPAALMFSTVFYASLYFTFVDSFSPPSDMGEESRDEPASPPT
ncbi:BPSS1780 family membrane protein [Methylibium rhizosphaerae]|uniref:BPSS1780 family membrane protein n=1 Tax=Methylibium rhizosphaerae TaxID=2570323 RepID=UPI001129CAC9|nr:BPSS1780 family membrane protein [Methylibium rhizosphaerae]